MGVRKPTGLGHLRNGLLLTLMLTLGVSAEAQISASGDPALEQFERAWQAARSGNRLLFDQIRGTLGDYVLYPYLQYEDYRFRRATADPAEVAGFLAGHPDWAFTAALQKTWLRALGESARWDALLQYAPGEEDTEVRCWLARARIERGEDEAALAEAQALWAVGRSQPEVCDPVFNWMRKNGGITPELAWLRIQRAMAAGNPRLTLYVARFLPTHEKLWAERWQQQERERYVHLDRARSWPDQQQKWDIITFGLGQLARKDADRAWTVFGLLDSSPGWNPELRAGVLRDLAFWSAVANDPDTFERLYAVPAAARDDGLLEWWARYGMASGRWAEVILAVASMGEELQASERWRFWDARARLILGDTDYAVERLENLSAEAGYYGFLAADLLQKPYAICEEDPGVSADDLARFQERPQVRRIEALRQAGLENWARSEWGLDIKLMDPRDRRMAAALAVEQRRPDLAIWALNGEGDRRLYTWRFPLVFVPQVAEQAGKRQLDVAWVLGLIRTESAMAEDAISAANARGLMQVLPGTAQALARRHAYTYSGKEQLLEAEHNIVFGTIYLRELMNEFNNNPVLVSGAYNAGPGAVKRWLGTLPGDDAAIWVETLPYFETRDYIPRVLAFATLYDWRLQKPVRRISSRMPAPDYGTIGGGIGPADFAEVACPQPVGANEPQATRRPRLGK